MPATLLDQRTTHVVLRGPLSALGVECQRGEVVDTSEWRNVQPLINTRRLDVLQYGAEPVASSDGRRWINAEFRDAHEATLVKPARRSKTSEEK